MSRPDQTIQEKSNFSTITLKAPPVPPLERLTRDIHRSDVADEAADRPTPSVNPRPARCPNLMHGLPIRFRPASKMRINPFGR